MSALDKVLEAYRDMFGVKTERANEIHRDACIEVAQMREKQTPCVWKQQDNYEWNLWESSCGNAFFFEEGTPKDNDCKFCCYCGHLLEQEAFVPEPDEDDE